MLSVLAFVATLALPARAVDIPPEVTPFENVNVFDGKGKTLMPGMVDAHRDADPGDGTVERALNHPVGTLPPVNPKLAKHGDARDHA